MRYFKLLFHVTIAILLLSGFAAAQSLRVIQERSFDVSSGELLEIESDIGDFKVRTWDRDEVHIKVYGDDDAEEEVRFYFEESSRGVLVEADADNRGWNWFDNIRLKYEIDIPENFNVDLSTAGGDIVLGDLIGNIKLRTSGGDIFIDNTEGELSASTSGGDLEIREVEGDVSVSTSGGDVFVQSSDGYLSARTSGGDIDAEYSGQNRGIELSTSGGDITAYVPKNLKADVYLKTSGGDIDVDLEARIREMSDDRFEGEINGGGLEFTCKTSGGDIVVKSI